MFISYSHFYIFFAKHGYRVFGSVRKIPDAQALQSELGERFQAMVFDVCDGDDIKTAPAQVSKTIGEEPVATIINNAGLALFGPDGTVRE